MTGGAKDGGRFRGKDFLLLLAGVVVLSALSYAIVFAPKLATVRQLRGDTAAANEELRHALSAWEEIAQSSRGDIERLETLAGSWGDRVPEAPETDRLMEEFLRAAARHNLQALRIEIPEQGGAGAGGTVSGPGQPEPEPETKTVEEMPIRVTFVSTYRDMAEFLDAIPRMKRLASVRSVTIRRHEGRMETKLEISAFHRRGA